MFNFQRLTKFQSDDKSIFSLPDTSSSTKLVSSTNSLTFQIAQYDNFSILNFFKYYKGRIHFYGSMPLLPDKSSSSRFSKLESDDKSFILLCLRISVLSCGNKILEMSVRFVYEISSCFNCLNFSKLQFPMAQVPDTSRTSKFSSQNSSRFLRLEAQIINSFMTLLVNFGIIFSHLKSSNPCIQNFYKNSRFVSFRLLLILSSPFYILFLYFRVMRELYSSCPDWCSDFCFIWFINNMCEVKYRHIIMKSYSNENCEYTMGLMQCQNKSISSIFIVYCLK
ncbi:Hypothetical_protein [Hexamita inflata]|uniref:Hypothetical_protein n=1 Tax=Hexamita inflata TaxID=28002 RepID=A0ABP1J014_9EUKA